MSLAKGEGSSRRKGKEIAIGDQPMEAEKGKEAPFFELNYSMEEKGSSDSSSESFL